MSSEVRQILIPIDFGDQSLIALRQSYNLARVTKSQITLLHVIDVDFLTTIQSLVTSKDDYEEEFLSESESKLKELAAQVKAEASVEVNTLIKTGKVYDEIVEAAGEINAALISWVPWAQ